MSALGHTAFKTGIESIPREASDELGLAVKRLIILVMVDQGLEAGDASHRLSRRGVYMIYVVVMKNAEVWYTMERSGGGVCSGLSIRW